MSLRNQSGVSLIEILITTLVLGIGLLGVAALQVSSVSSNQEGFFTSQATSIAEDYASRVRGAKMASIVPSVWETPTVMSSAQTLPNILASYNAGGVMACANPPNPICRNNEGAAPASCSLSQMGAFDQWEVCSAAEDTLPEGKVRTQLSGNRLTIIVDWEPASERADIGNLKNVNSNCVVLTGSDSRNCVIMEVYP